MTRKLGDRPVDVLERRFQALRDQLGAMPEACRPELDTALQGLSQAIAALRAAPAGEPPEDLAALSLAGFQGQSATGQPPGASPGPCEAILQHVFKAIPDLLTIHDRDFNTIMSNWHGYESVPEAERQGRPKCYRVYHHRDHFCEPCHALEVLATGQPVRLEKVNPVDGRIREVSAYPIRDESGRVVLVVEHVRDITARHLAEEALRQSEELYRSLFENMLNGLAYCKMLFEQNQPQDFIYLDVNRAFEALTGLKDVVGKKVSEVIPGLRESNPELLEIYGRVALTGKPERFETYVKALKMWLSISVYSPEKEYFVAVFEVITERKQAEERLKQINTCLLDLGPDFEANVERLTALCGELLGATCALYNRLDGGMLCSLGQWHTPPDFDPRDKPDGHICYDVIQQAVVDAMVVRNLPETAYATTDPNVSRYGLMTYAGHVVRCNDDPVGSLCVVFQEDVEPTDDDKSILGIIAASLSKEEERKQAEEALRESEEKYRVLFEESAHGILAVDMETGRFGYANPSICRMLGYSDIELRQLGIADIHPKDSLDQVMFEFESQLRGEKPRVLVVPCLRKDGTVFYADIAGAQSIIQGRRYAVDFFMDVTARRQAEEALQESEQRFRLMAETIQDVFWMATPDIGKMVYVSPAYEQVWGRPCQELYQSPLSFMDAIHPEDRERVKSEITAASEQGIPWRHEYRIIRPDGSVRWIQDRGFPVRDDQGRVILFTGVATDVTEHKALEQQLLQAQKMEAVGRLAGGVAHDFNNLLMAITGYGELMRAKVLKDDPLYGYLENILKAGDRAAALTQQLLTFSRQKIVQPQVVDLNRVVLDLEPMLRRLIGEDLDLEVVTDRRAGAVKADPGQMGQIIMNLVVNARDAMPQGGRLTLKTAPVELKKSRHTRFGQAPPGAYVRLVVADTGVGMDEAIQAHVFEPFFTTKEPGKGTGLGLSTVYGIVKQSGGYLDLASKPGAGSAFTIYLPRLDAVVPPPKAKIPITASFRGEETVLLVEDEDVLRVLLAKFLRLYGYTVVEARHGGEALLTCERHPGPIHLMVTDVVMPQMSGRELADRLTPLRPEMKVLYMSGYTEDALVQHGVADLSVAFLQKPFRPIELARQVYAVLHPPVSQ